MGPVAVQGHVNMKWLDNGQRPWTGAAQRIGLVRANAPASRPRGCLRRAASTPSRSTRVPRILTCLSLRPIRSSHPSGLWRTRSTVRNTRQGAAPLPSMPASMLPGRQCPSTQIPEATYGLATINSPTPGGVSCPFSSTSAHRLFFVSNLLSSSQAGRHTGARDIRQYAGQ